ncbi:TetR/AcrR family transcriptional regulator [Acetobacterium sp.]|uniref:TetR/AcrR family transcriptional regulator n=1 Tax=Acetobacterium sp. TaxID=1872094 RepID=UPI00359479F1
MRRKKIDRRIRKTEQQLQTGLAQLLLEKSVEKITVSELSDLVDINRGTFYLHYKDVFDMLDQIENEIFIDFCTLLNRYASIFERSNTRPFLIDAFRFIAENDEMLHVLLCKPGHLAFLNRLQAVFKENFFEHWLEKYHPKVSPQIEYFYSYILSGCMGIMIQWLNTGMKESPEQMAKFTEIIIFEGFKFFETK